MKDIATIRRLLTPIAYAFGVKRMYLFGSFAKGTAGENSDVDILIEKGAPLSLLGLSDMRLRCQEVLKLPVDLVTTSGIEEDFQREIAGTEILLYVYSPDWRALQSAV